MASNWEQDWPAYVILLIVAGVFITSIVKAKSQQKEKMKVQKEKKGQK